MFCEPDTSQGDCVSVCGCVLQLHICCKSRLLLSLVIIVLSGVVTVLSLCGLIMSWQHVQVVNLPLPYESWDRLLMTPVTLSTGISVYGQMNDFVMYLSE